LKTYQKHKLQRADKKTIFTPVIKEIYTDIINVKIII
jgi:hypothetical protein